MKLFLLSPAIVLISSLLLDLTLTSNAETNWDDFVAEVVQAVNSSSTYTLKTNNDDYFSGSQNEKPKVYGVFDFIIIGGGTAGGVLANRLTEENFNVLVIEAGTKGPSWAAALGLAAYFFNTDWNWGYNTTRQRHGCLATRDQRCFYVRGKALGGSSILNGGMYVRGNARDFDKWKEMGNKGWSYDDCLPYFKKSENAKFYMDIERDYHGFNGLQAIDLPVSDTPNLTNTLIDAFVELGKPSRDYNGQSQDAVSRVQSYIDFNIRSSSEQAFLRPARNRTNLKISLESLVTKIRINPLTKRAFGVEFIKKGRRYIALAQKEIILSAGSVNSPQVLMLSGIGPKKELEKHGIVVEADLPVGENLLDHVQYGGVFYRTNSTFYNTTLVEYLELWRQGHRPLNSGVNVQVVSFFNNCLNFSEDVPHIEMLGQMGSSSMASFYQLNDEYIEAFQSVNDNSDILITIVLLHPKSVGRITLQSKDPRDYPLIDTNFLADPQDVETIYDGAQTALRLNDTEVFKNWKAEHLVIPQPGCDEEYEKLTKDWWICSIRQLSMTIYHPVGTTKMGVSPKNSVVDNKLRVHGIRNLRVVDAGVMPSLISGHTNAAVVMIAEKISDDIKRAHRKN